MRAAILLVAGAGILLLVPPGPRAGAAPGAVLEIPDAAAGVTGLEAADCRGVRVEETEAGLAFAVTLGAPVAEGMFTCVHVYLDADGNPDTGIGGSEMWFRAAVGSRFRPNAWRPDTPGVPEPLSLARLSFSTVEDMESLAEGTSGKNWINYRLGGAPAIDGATMRFTIPTKVLARVGDRYGAALDLRLQVETSCGDQPLCLEYRAADDGLPIRVDGDDRDWSGGPSVADSGGELFASLRMLDLTRLRVDHEAKSLFLCLDTDLPGFSDPLAVSPDLSVYQAVVVLVEPVDEAYEAPRRATFFRGRPPVGAAAEPWAAKGRTIEAALARTGADGRVRVLAWSESTHRDMVPDKDRVRFPPGANR